MRTVTAMQAAGHNNSWYRQHRARPRTKREDGAPTVSKREAETWKPGPPAYGLYAAGAFEAGGALTTLSGENGLDLIGNRAINQMIGDGQRELLKEFFETGKAPEGLTDKSLQLYKEVAQRAIAAGKDQLGVQAQRLQMITSALK